MKWKCQCIKHISPIRPNKKPTWSDLDNPNKAQLHSIRNPNLSSVSISLLSWLFFPYGQNMILFFKMFQFQFQFSHWSFKNVLILPLLYLTFPSLCEWQWVMWQMSFLFLFLEKIINTPWALSLNQIHPMYSIWKIKPLNYQKCSN